MKQYAVYILTNVNKTVLYVGVTDHLERRLREHREGSGNAFTARYKVTNLIYYEQYADVRVAIAREKEIKGWRREKKERLIATMNPLWLFLDQIE